MPCYYRYVWKVNIYGQVYRAIEWIQYDSETERLKRINQYNRYRAEQRLLKYQEREYQRQLEQEYRYRLDLAYQEQRRKEAERQRRAQAARLAIKREEQTWQKIELARQRKHRAWEDKQGVVDKPRGNESMIVHSGCSAAMQGGLFKAEMPGLRGGGEVRDGKGGGSGDGKDKRPLVEQVRSVVFRNIPKAFGGLGEV